MVWPAPGVSPMKNSLPKSDRTGWAASNAALGPPTITASVPSAAPFTPPETGASSEAILRSARPSASVLAAAGPLVDRSTKVLILAAVDHAVRAQRRRLNDRRIGQGGEHQLRRVRHRLGRCGALGPALDQRRNGRVADVEHRQRMAGVEQPARHAPAHAPKPDESDVLAHRPVVSLLVIGLEQTQIDRVRQDLVAGVVAM